MCDWCTDIVGLSVRAFNHFIQVIVDLVPSSGKLIDKMKFAQNIFSRKCEVFWEFMLSLVMTGYLYLLFSSPVRPNQPVNIPMDMRDENPMDIT